MNLTGGWTIKDLKKKGRLISIEIWNDQRIPCLFCLQLNGPIYPNNKTIGARDVSKIA